MRLPILACVLACIAPATAGANGVRWDLQPAQVAVERLDAAWVEHLGYAQRLGVRVAYGAAARWRAWSLGLEQGHASAHADFGLLDGSTSRLNRTDTLLELRWRSPQLPGGWRLQPAVGIGRLDLRYRPDRLSFMAGGQSVSVDLPPETRWTRHVAAELLHDLSGHTQLVVRAAWRAYTLDLGTPEGTATRSMADVQAGLAIRVQPF